MPQKDSKLQDIKTIIHKMFSERGIDNVDLSMFDQEQKRDIYENYADMFESYLGPPFLSITVKAYHKAGAFLKIKQRLTREAQKALGDEFFSYSLVCYKLLDDKPMIKFLEENHTNDGKDFKIDYSKLYNELLNLVKITP